MDRQFDVLPLMSAGDYVTHGDTLYITFNPGSAAKEEDSESSPAAVLNTRMTGGVMARFTYQAVDEGFQCTLEFGDQKLASVAPSKKMAKQLVATKYLEANPSPDKILGGQPFASLAKSHNNEVGVGGNGKHILPNPWRGRVNPVMVTRKNVS